MGGQQDRSGIGNESTHWCVPQRGYNLRMIAVKVPAWLNGVSAHLSVRWCATDENIPRVRAPGQRAGGRESGLLVAGIVLRVAMDARKGTMGARRPLVLLERSRGRPRDAGCQLAGL